MKTLKLISSLLVPLTSGAASALAADMVILQRPTATYSQPYLGDFSIGRTIDGLLYDNYGWAIQGAIANQTAAYQTRDNIGFAGGSLLTFTLIQNGDWFDFVHTLGRFRLAVTTDDRSTFCDGLATGSNVTANWTVLQPFSFESERGATLTRLADNSILASGISAFNETYTVTAPTSLTGITGIRLEVLQDPSLPYNGPGRCVGNGNFILSEFEVGIAPIPEPSIAGILALALAVTCVMKKRSLVPAKTNG